MRYASLRDDVRGAKLALDTAHARLQPPLPRDRPRGGEPTQPLKPKVGVIVGAGILPSPLFGLLLLILLELRRDVVSETCAGAPAAAARLGRVALAQGRAGVRASDASSRQQTALRATGEAGRRCAPRAASR